MFGIPQNIENYSVLQKIQSTPKTQKIPHPWAALKIKSPSLWQIWLDCMFLSILHNGSTRNVILAITFCHGQCSLDIDLLQWPFKYWFLECTESNTGHHCVWRCASDSKQYEANNIHSAECSARYNKTYNIRRTKYQISIIFQLFSPNSLKPGVKSRMTTQLEQRRQVMLELHLRDQKFIAYWGATYIKGLY